MATAAGGTSGGAGTGTGADGSVGVRVSVGRERALWLPGQG